MRPCQTILVLEDLRNSFSGPLYRKGVELSSNDRSTVLEVYSQSILLMLDLGYLNSGSLARDAMRLFVDMTRADVLSLNSAFAELLHLVRCKSPKGFKALCRQVSGHLYSLVKGDLLNMLDGDVYSAKRLIQLFSYTSRLTLNDIDLTQQCLEAYLEVESNISNDFPDGLLSSLNRKIRKWMESYDPNQIQFRHGPGGVAEHGRTSLEVKYKSLSHDQMLCYAFGEPWWSVGPFGSTLDRISRTIFVPKSYKTFRTISMEPATLQYCQQGVWREIDRVVSSSSFLRSRIGFHEQTRNQRLAKEGSVNRNYATIDLSSASDSVSYELVKRLFRGTKLLRFIMATRSRETLLPNGQIIRLKKFAPMGSALCFPIETLIFAAVCEHVTQGRGISSDYSVFGDDIIVPTNCAEDVMTVLGRLGFLINREKSFYDHNCWFRESCGAEYCDGFDVTPMRVSRKYAHTQQLVQASQLIDLANEAYRRSFRNLRQFYLHKLKSLGHTPLFAPTALLGDNYTNYHTKHKWNRHLQRIECKTTCLVTKPYGVMDESIRYRHWLESTHNRKSVGDGFESVTNRSTVFAKDRWTMKPYELPDQEYIDIHVQRGSKLLLP